MYQESMLSHSQVQSLLALAVEKAQEKGPIAVSIVDRSGELQGFIRMDGVLYSSVTLAHNKAITAARHGHATKVLGQWLTENNIPCQFLGEDHFAGFAGGVPIKLGEHVIGGIGISGLDESDDMSIAASLIEALSLEESN